MSRKIPCRVLEQSLEESKSGTKRKRGDLWFVDPLNPHERQRQDLWPVGLKNVGNTCWFSAVIQVGAAVILKFAKSWNSHQQEAGTPHPTG